MFVVLMLHVLFSSCSANVTYDVMPSTGVPDSCLVKEVQGVFSAGSCSLQCLYEGPPCATIEMRNNQICRLGSCLAAIQSNANIVAYGKFSCPTNYTRVGQACYRVLQERHLITTSAAACASDSGFLALPETSEQIRALSSYLTILNPQTPNSADCHHLHGAYIGLQYRPSSRELMRQGVVINVTDDVWVNGFPNDNIARTSIMLSRLYAFRLVNIAGVYDRRCPVCQKDFIYG